MQGKKHGTIILNCVCGDKYPHEFQDTTYGKNRRVFNYYPSSTPGAFDSRCTVCTKEVKNVKL